MGNPAANLDMFSVFANFFVLLICNARHSVNLFITNTGLQNLASVQDPALAKSLPLAAWSFLNFTAASYLSGRYLQQFTQGSHSLLAALHPHVGVEVLLSATCFRDQLER